MAKTKMPPDRRPSTQEGDTVFASTGPVGHRKRMRQRVLAHGAGALADYELLEMLLFYAVPRRDTKPLAKSLINQFGSFSGVLESTPDALHGAGMPRGAAALCTQLPHVAACLVQDRSGERTYLGDWDSLLQYCNTALKVVERPQMRMLLLDSRNSLLVDEQLVRPTCGPEAEAEAEAVRQSVAHILQRALEVQSCAVVTVYLAEQGQDVRALLQSSAPFVAAMRQSAPLLAVSLHDHLVIGPEVWASARQMAPDW
ncbi:DNA repair protein RadC [Acetobacter lambici]|uniref:DNA repair protein RadC n=1 Tax=Acetobacter lambici TaxID=1332824 RepID=A0ABT1EW59_9PROT|nr:JAB domain-containing protein [Acetobacter lambici]MCP1241146.1 DNA repair protein RadC [Acetobacter lambici]MCP1257182.1 DNA repair protein RadC [Acetobacter lambici]NHO55674.1 DNA repair protein RadC [Acetobacter lambici]